MLNCGSISLTAGTYILTLNCGFSIVTGSTSIDQMLLSHSTSSTTLSTNSNLYIDNATETGSWNVGLQRVMSTTAIVTHASTTIYYMLLQV
jgi:hypothetical protein